MRNTNIFDLIHKVVLVILLMGTLPLALPAAENLIYNLKFKQLSAPYALPTNEVQKVYQDKDGFMFNAYIRKIIGGYTLKSGRNRNNRF